MLYHAMKDILVHNNQEREEIQDDLRERNAKA